MMKSLLRMFDENKSIRIETNVSNLIIETYLNQKYKKIWLFIIYYSKKLSLIEQNYDVHDKKLLIIITALNNGKMYIEKTSQFTIFTNYINLLTFITTKKLNKRQMKWLKLLKQYKFKIQYMLKI